MDLLPWGAYAYIYIYRYMVTPIEPTMPEQQRSELLATNNDYVIKTNHVVHHGGVGHHVQNWHAPRSPMRVGANTKTSLPNTTGYTAYQVFDLVHQSD